MKFDYLSPDYIDYVIMHPFVRQHVTFLPALFILVLARLLPIISLAPFLGSKVLPHPVKVGLGVALFSIAFPYVLAQTTVPVQFNLLFVFLFVKELFIGLIIGFFSLVPFIIAETGGILIDHQRGAASFQVNDPIIQNMGSPIGVFFNVFVVYLFFMFNGPIIFIDTVIESFQLLPADQFLDGRVVEQGSLFWHQVLLLYNTLMVSAVKIATPALLIILMTDTFLGIANRLAPQVQMVFLGMPLKALFGSGILWVGWFVIIRYIGAFSMEWLDTITRTIHSLAII